MKGCPARTMHRRPTIARTTNSDRAVFYAHGGRCPTPDVHPSACRFHELGHATGRRAVTVVAVMPQKPQTRQTLRRCGGSTLPGRHRPNERQSSCDAADLVAGSSQTGEPAAEIENGEAVLPGVPTPPKEHPGLSMHARIDRR